jgi:hypothetical protein
MLSAAKHLAAQLDRPFASLRVILEGLISLSVLFFETALSALSGCSDIPINYLKYIA